MLLLIQMEQYSQELGQMVLYVNNCKLVVDFTVNLTFVLKENTLLIAKAGTQSFNPEVSIVILYKISVLRFFNRLKRLVRESLIASFIFESFILIDQ